MAQIGSTEYGVLAQALHLKAMSQAHDDDAAWSWRTIRRLTKDCSSKRIRCEKDAAEAILSSITRKRVITTTRQLEDSIELLSEIAKLMLPNEIKTTALWLRDLHIQVQLARKGMRASAMKIPLAVAVRPVAITRNGEKVAIYAALNRSLP